MLELDIVFLHHFKIDALLDWVNLYCSIIELPCLDVDVSFIVVVRVDFLYFLYVDMKVASASY